VARPKKLTTAVLEQIPTLVDRGLDAPEISRMIGCTLGTLRATCSRSKISLRRKTPTQTGEWAERASAPRSVSLSTRRVSSDGHATMTLQLTEMTVDLLRQQAIGKGLAPSTLATMLLEMIVRDGLYDAVLDEHDASKRPPLSARFLP
jgi:hypothetical protein